MSMPERTLVNCEHCGGEYEFTWYRSINVSLDPELKEKVISGEIFKTKCPHCGKDSYMLFPFLYHDMEKNFMIYVDTKERLEQGVEAHKKTQEEMKKQFPGLNLPVIESAPLERYEKVETLINAYDYNLDLVCLGLYFDVMEKQMDNMFKNVIGYNGVFDMHLKKVDGKLSVYYELDEDGRGTYFDFDMELYNDIKTEAQKAKLC